MLKGAAAKGDSLYTTTIHTLVIAVLKLSTLTKVGFKFIPCE